jgi:hypothetical protein
MVRLQHASQGDDATADLRKAPVARLSWEASRERAVLKPEEGVPI